MKFSGGGFRIASPDQVISAVCSLDWKKRPSFRSDSDIDIVVDFNEPIGIEFVDLADELERLLQRKVDLVSKAGIKPKYFKAIEQEILYV